MIKKILVSQPKPASEKSPYYDIEKEYGVECVFRPFFKVEGLTAKEFRQQKINLLDYTAVVFTYAGIAAGGFCDSGQYQRQHHFRNRAVW